MGSLLASTTLAPGQLILNQTRWYLFVLDQTISLTAATPLGFRVVSSAGAGEYEAAYHQPGGYSDGKMVYSGQIGGLPWTTNDLHLAFETLWTNRDERSEIRIARVTGQANLVGLMLFKQQPVTLQSSTNLRDDTSSPYFGSQDKLPAIASVHHWTLANGCPPNPAPTNSATTGAAPHRITTDNYLCPLAPVRFVTNESGGHIWPDAADAAGYNASVEVLAWFMAFTTP